MPRFFKFNSSLCHAVEFEFFSFACHSRRTFCSAHHRAVRIFSLHLLTGTFRSWRHAMQLPFSGGWSNQLKGLTSDS
jgi:hypothetical protein